MKVGLVAAGLLASIFSRVTLVKSQDLTDTVFFTECDCSRVRVTSDSTARTFPIVSPTAFDSSTLLVTETGFDCPGGDSVALPTRSGAEITGQTDVIGLQGKLVGNLFFDNNVQKDWTLFMNVDISKMNEREEVTLANSLVFTVELEVFSINNGNRVVDFQFIHNFATSFQRITMSVEVSAAISENLNVVVGFSSELPALVACVDTTCESQALSVTSGNPDGVNGDDPIPLELITGAQFSTPVTLQHLRFVDGKNFNDANAMGTSLTAVLGKVQVLSLPLVNLEGKEANEEETTNINITDLFDGSLEGVEITYTNPSSEGGSVVETADEAIFTYTSEVDFFGVDEVTFKYGRPAPYSCDSNDFNLEVVVANAPDTPTARSFSVPETFAEFEKEVEDEIFALSRDNPNGDLPPEQRVLLSGSIKLTPSSSGELKLGPNCQTTINADTLVSVTDGKAHICFTPNQGVSGDVPIQFVVVDGNLESLPGTITFNVENPFGIAPGNELPGGTTANVVEDTSDTLNVGDLTDFKPPGENRDLDLKIVKTVNSNFGTLFKISGDTETALDVGDIVLASDVIRFQPARNVFTATPEVSALDQVGNPVGDCPASTRVNDQFVLDPNGFCLVDFTYRSSSVVSGDIRSDSDEVGRVQFKILADDDQEASIVVNVDKIAATIDENEAIATLSGVEVQNDLGSDVFDVSVVLEILPSNGEVITFKVNGAAGNNIVELTNEVPDGNDCALQQCTKVTITGAPSLVTQIINTVEVTVPADAVGPQVKFNVAGFEENAISVEFEPQQPIVPGFFDSLTNVIAVSAGGGGLVIIVAGVFIVRHRRIQSAREKDDILVQADMVVPGRDGGRKREATSRAKRTNNPRGRDLEDERSAGVVSVSLEPDDELFDWEKHFDEKTQQPYFFNPKTGETSWDPPKIRGKQIRGKKGGDDEGIDPSL